MGDKDWKTLSGITADLKDSFDIKEELDLIPNRQIIYFRTGRPTTTPSRRRRFKL